jgi:hypothetical protein
MKKLILFVILGVLFGCEVSIIRQPELAVNQVWVKEDSNPFRENPTRRCKVLEIKDGYVKYECSLYGKKDGKFWYVQEPESDPVGWFTSVNTYSHTVSQEEVK